MCQNETIRMTKNIKRIVWNLQKRNLDDLKPHPKNPRQFTEKGLKDLENSIDSIGFMQPININQDGTILSGHARAMKLKEMGEIEVDVMMPDRLLTPKQEEEILIRANANTAGQWDFDLLANEFDNIDLNDWGLEVPKINNDSFFDLLEEEENKEGGVSGLNEKPLASSDEYSTFELVMNHQNKILLIQVLNQIKAKEKFEKMEDSLIFLINFFINNE